MAFEFIDYEEYAWKEHSIYFAGTLVTKCTGYHYSVESNDEEIYAAGDEPLSIGSGNRKYAGNVKMLAGGVDDMNRSARLAGGRDLTDVKFDIVTVYLPAIGRPLVTDTCVGFKFNKFEKGWDQGATKMEVDLPGKFLRLVTE